MSMKGFTRAGHFPTLMAALLDRLKKSKARARDAWQEGIEPKTPAQFIPLIPIDTPVGSGLSRTSAEISA